MMMMIFYFCHAMLETNYQTAATTNAAVDRVLTELLESGFTNFLRVGSRKRISKDLFPYTLHCLQRDEDDINEMKEMLKATADIGEQRTVCFHFIGHIRFLTYAEDHISLSLYFSSSSDNRSKRRSRQ